MEPTNEECLDFLEQLRWGGKPDCPYCSSNRVTSIRNERRYHCNYCFTSFSVTINTMFHGSHVSMDKWFKAIHMFLEQEQKVSVRFLARSITVTNNTSASMIKK